MSEVVKLIIEISKEDIEFIRKTSFVEDETTMFKQSPSDRQGTMMLFRLMDSVKDGKPLSEVLAEIKGEIRELRDSWEKDCYHDEAEALNIALKIIDKHISEEGDKE